MTGIGRRRSSYPGLRALVLLPRSVVMAVLAVGRRRPRDLVAGIFGVGLGVWAWFVAYLVVVGFLRGPLYGFVVPGPYDDAWGGPSLAGAWAVHAAVWVGVAVAALLMWWAVVVLADRVTAHVRGERRTAWAVVVATVLLVAAVLFVWLWSRQL
ncbi:hypothetical protein LQ327_12625 [Actinomycetospora endophytica]|uniref:Yip1 domain-containing protein n=1 Tax=Actinomycetospora endophytica TaxID=2291215 RepID=A0ABS8P7G8_9PSEU|nr:hypothetical protein [Actinomycetospora endophytica]MCD2194220.1 hypothetical protein [Actinomycetospora endophytica]